MSYFTFLRGAGCYQVIKILRSDAKFSLVILSLNLDFIKFPIEKGDLYTQANICKDFLINELSVFIFKSIKIKENLKLSPPIAQAKFQMLTNHMWQVATMPDSTGLGGQLRLAPMGPSTSELEWGSAHVVCKEPDGNVVDFADHTIFIVTTQLCCCILKVAAD